MDNMDNCFVSEAKIVSNSAKDGTVKVKMATVGERNLNGFLLRNDKALKFKSNASYPLFFEHKTDMDNLIGFFNVLILKAFLLSSFIAVKSAVASLSPNNFSYFSLNSTGSFNNFFILSY